MQSSRILAFPISLALFTIVITGYGIQKPGEKEAIVLNAKEPIEHFIEQQILEESQVSEEIASASEEIAHIETELELNFIEAEELAEEIAQIEVEPELVPEEAEELVEEIAQVEVEPELVPEDTEELAEEIAQVEAEPELVPEEAQASDEIASNIDTDGWAGPGKYSGIYFSNKHSYTAWRSKFHRYSREKKEKHSHRRAIGIYKGE